ncbi:Piwi domain-containing protein [Blastocladiella britannica]|nr:Piwi domain-containing protein [Blastocladiella britannica]
MQVNLAPHEIDRAEYVFRSFSVFPNYGATSSSDGADAHEAAEPAALPLAPTTALGSMRKKTLVISGFTRTSAANTPFTLNGRAMTVAQYYAEAHGIRLRAPHLPCAMVQAGKLRRAPGQDRISSARLGATDASNPETIYLPLELATMAPSQKASRPLGRIDHNAFKVSALSPHDRAAHIVRAGRAIYDPPLSLLVAYGLQPQFELTAAPARQLLAPTLLFHPTSQEPTLVPTQGRWDMSVHKLYRPAEGGIRRWAVLPFVPCDPKLVNRFMTRLSQRLRMFGVHVEDRDPPILPPCDPGMGKEMLRTAVRHAYLQAGAEAQHPDVLVFVLPNRGFELYHELKRICDTELGVVSQCLTLKVAQDSRPTHVENIALKLNVKLPGRGQNFAVDPAQLLALQEVPTMFMGADVTHPAQEIRSPSIASVVGSMDRYGARYACATRIQPIRAEIILDIGSMVVELLQKFYMSTGCKPQRIMFFRDGISESQFSDVMRCEVAAIRKAFRAMDPEYKPLLTFMVVQKRHHTRFFAVAPEQADPRTGNLPPGLFVDSETAHPFEFDFYIQSHSTLQGLAKPTRYSVLVDESKFAPNDLAELCWRQCFLYPRGSRSVSMVPAGFYAHVTAARAKAHVVDGEQDGQRYFALQVVKPGLEGTMYFM